jgi:hypothetical protein
VSIARAQVQETARSFSSSLYVSFFLEGVQQFHNCFFGAVLVEPDRAFVFD